MKTKINPLRILLIGILTLSFFYGNAQHECNFESKQEINSADWAQATRSGEECFDKCKNWYASKTIEVFFHFIDSAGVRNFPPSHSFAQGIIDEANLKLQNNNPPGAYGPANITLNFAGKAHYDFDRWCLPANPFPDALPGVVNVFMRERCADWEGNPCPGGSGSCAGGSCCGHGGIKLNRSYWRYTHEFDHACSSWEKQRADILLHELGHLWDIDHAFEWDGCNDTPGNNNNFMDNNSCEHDHFTCCQLRNIHGFLEYNQPDYMSMDSQVPCKAGFELINIGNDCHVSFSSTSTPSTGATITNYSWCVSSIENDGCQDIFIEDGGSRLRFTKACEGEYEVCLCIEDSDGCLSYFCDWLTFVPEVNAVLVNEDGEPTTTFCYLEDVYLDASASEFYTEYFISVWEFDDNGNSINYSRFEDWFQDGLVPNPFNISQYDWHPDKHWMFCPGGNYEIQFALKNQCDDWEAIMLEFNVECCADEPSAQFELIAPTSNGSSYTMQATNYNQYENSPEACLVTHAWCVYKKDKLGELEYITTVFGPDFSYPGQNGTSYTVVHKVKSPCGEDCYAVTIFRDAKNLGTGDTVQTKSVPCPDDCAPECEAPIGLSCEEIDGSMRLSWDPVIGATSYVLEINFNDPDCCKPFGNPTSLQYFSEGDGVFVPIQEERCWSWRVKTICGPETSPWSEKVCMPLGTRCFSHGGDGSSRRLTNETSSSSILTLEAIPNPFDEVIYFKMTAVDYIQQLSIVDMLGRTVAQKEIAAATSQIQLNVEKLASGVYYAVLGQPDGSSKTKKIIKR